MDQLAANVEEELKQSLNRERTNSGWMFSLIKSLHRDASFKRLSRDLREEIEAVIAAVE